MDDYYFNGNESSYELNYPNILEDKGQELFNNFKSSKQTRPENLDTNGNLDVFRVIKEFNDAGFQDVVKKLYNIPDYREHKPMNTSYYGGRIDFILSYNGTNKALDNIKLYTHYNDLSDHIPIIVDIKLPEEHTDELVELKKEILNSKLYNEYFNNNILQKYKHYYVSNLINEYELYKKFNEIKKNIAVMSQNPFIQGGGNLMYKLEKYITKYSQSFKDSHMTRLNFYAKKLVGGNIQQVTHIDHILQNNFIPKILTESEIIHEAKVLKDNDTSKISDTTIHRKISETDPSFDNELKKYFLKKKLRTIVTDTFIKECLDKDTYGLLVNYVSTELYTHLYEFIYKFNLTSSIKLDENHVILIYKNSNVVSLYLRYFHNKLSSVEQGKEDELEKLISEVKYGDIDYQVIINFEKLENTFGATISKQIVNNIKGVMYLALNKIKNVISLLTKYHTNKFLNKIKDCTDEFESVLENLSIIDNKGGSNDTTLLKISMGEKEFDLSSKEIKTSTTQTKKYSYLNKNITFTDSKSHKLHTASALKSQKEGFIDIPSFKESKNDTFIAYLENIRYISYKNISHFSLLRLKLNTVFTVEGKLTSLEQFGGMSNSWSDEWSYNDGVKTFSYDNYDMSRYDFNEYDEDEVSEYDEDEVSVKTETDNESEASTQESDDSIDKNIVNISIPVELIDVSIPEKTDNSQIVIINIFEFLEIENKKQTNTFIKISDTDINEINKQYFHEVENVIIPTINYMFVDIVMMLYYQNFFPWNEKKYNKRLNRLFYIYLVCYTDK